MQSPLQITFRGCPSSDAVAERIRSKVAKLEQHYGRITSCRVVIESHQHHKTFRVSVDLMIPGAEILASHDPSHGSANEDLYVAIRDAFVAVDRRLQEQVRQRQERREARASGE
ncbi:MAG TPA: HPF/RaiA family ribosome-associated protein [Polyangiaceae bacterium]|jgi:ribosomal subunit interface protein|nr:HPF/RaiA family ribosome-associated protein [Polyangiaceae bacterium]